MVKQFELKTKLHLILYQQLDMVDLCPASSKNQRGFSVDVASIHFNLIFNAIKLETG